MKITCVSDLHGYYPTLDGGDLLIIAGDLTARDTPHEYGHFACWMQIQNYNKKIIIAGNHDNHFERKGFELINDVYNSIDTEYLCDSGTEFEGLKIWGSPWTKTFNGMNPRCKAFTFDTEEELYDKFVQIPPDVDILITHSPAYGILDGPENEDGSKFHLGSIALFSWLKYVGRPRLHVCGHIHEGYGQEEIFPTYENKMMISVNCSIMNSKYQPVNQPINIEL